MTTDPSLRTRFHQIMVASSTAPKVGSTQHEHFNSMQLSSPVTYLIKSMLKNTSQFEYQYHISKRRKKYLQYYNYISLAYIFLDNYYLLTQLISDQNKYWVYWKCSYFFHSLFIFRKNQCINRKQIVLENVEIVKNVNWQFSTIFSFWLMF